MNHRSCREGVGILAQSLERDLHLDHEKAAPMRTPPPAVTGALLACLDSCPVGGSKPSTSVRRPPTPRTLCVARSKGSSWIQFCSGSRGIQSNPCSDREASSRFSSSISIQFSGPFPGFYQKIPIPACPKAELWDWWSCAHTAAPGSGVLGTPRAVRLTGAEKDTHF